MITSVQTPTEQLKQGIHHSYNHYYASGLYDTRYPQANQNVLDFILQTFTEVESLPSEQPVKPVFLDYGCGNGRYLLPLLQLTEWHALAFDISSQAIAQLQERLKQQQFSLRCDIAQKWPQPGEYHVALLLYGVLGHIKTQQQRIQLLTSIHERLISTLIVSVPNTQRRFLCRRLFNMKKTDIEYQRSHNNQPMHFHYHLYCLDELKHELSQSNFKISSIQAESMLPEKWITRSAFWRSIDHILCKILPLQWAYGFLVSAKT